ncbi:transcription elongation factor [Actinoplanes sp. NPDC026623]|uniref:MOSC domain-containing protein n=1 Tax=Actinoplanes sp. NPDC026623 TaxID=3155610 RepID=UPI003410967D
MGVYQRKPAVAGIVGAEPGVVASVSCNDVYSFTKPTRGEITLVAGLGVAGDVHAGTTVKHRGRVAADPTQPNLRQVHLIHAELHDEVRTQGYEVPAGGLGENVTTVGLDLLGLPVGTILRFGPPPVGAAAAATTTGPPDGAAVRAGCADGAAGPVGPVERAAAVVAAAAAADTGDAIAAVVAVLAARIEAEYLTESPAKNPAGSQAKSSAGNLAGNPAGSSAGNLAGSPAGKGAGNSEVGEGAPRPAVIVTGLRNPCNQINGYRAGLLKHVLGRDGRGNLVRKAGVMAVVLHGGTIRPGDRISVDLPESPHLPLDRV